MSITPVSSLLKSLSRNSTVVVVLKNMVMITIVMRLVMMGMVMLVITDNPDNGGDDDDDGEQCAHFRANAPKRRSQTVFPGTPGSPSHPGTNVDRTLLSHLCSTPLGASGVRDTTT